MQRSLNPRRQRHIVDFLADRQWRDPLVDRRTTADQKPP
jgi:hypothetical protein